jgi:hypothetical protein
MKSMRWTAHRTGRGGLFAGAAVALALAGCSAGTSASGGSATSAAAGGGGQSAGASGSSGSAAARPAASALFSTSQLSAIGMVAASDGPDYGAVASATQSLPQKALWYSGGESPSLNVDASQDFRTAVVIFGQGSSQPTAVALDPDGSDTTLANVSNSEDGALFSADGKWLVFIPGASDEDPVTQVYQLSGGQAQPVTFTAPSQVSDNVAGGNTTILGFTASDQLLVDNGGGLWEVSASGSTAQPFAASLSYNFAGGIVDEVTGTPAAGIIALDGQTFDSNGVPSNSTVLLSPSGSVLHTFAGGSPVSFSPDGTHLIVNTTPANASNAEDTSEELCDVVTYVCGPGAGGTMGPWLPNGDLDASVNGDVHAWWSPATEAQDTIPSAFRQFDSLNLVLPTQMVTRIAAVKPPAGNITGGS